MAGRTLAGMTGDPFVTHRSLLFTVAYEMLGSAADAEDVVQETWLRWDGVDQAQVHDPRAYLVRMVTRQALNRLRSVSRRREDYVGEWLPEPLLTAPDVAEDIELAESVSIAMLTVLETLGPAERAVFVLHEVFETPYPEIAEVVGKTPAAVSTGDVRSLAAVLAPDVVLVADGGGVVAAVRQPVTGVDRVVTLLARAAGNPDFALSPAWFNGMPGVRLTAAGAPAAVSVVVEDGLITRIYAVTNPHKLGWLDKVADLSR